MADEILKRLTCPRCGKGIHLLRKDFTITVYRTPFFPNLQTWSADPAIECPWDCGCHFFITRGRVEVINTPATT